MQPVPIHTAKTQLSKLIERACAGEEVIIMRGRTPVVRLVPIEPLVKQRAFGVLRGLVWLDEAFFEPLPPDELAAWEG